MPKENILIVNGDDYVRKALVDCLSAEYNVYTSATFKNSINTFKDRQINTVITEIDTAEESGIEIVSKLQELNSDIPIVVVTTHSSVSLAVEAMKAGAYDYITKPFNPDELKFVILHALERKKLQDETKEKQVYQELALMDALTQLYNRGYFDELLRREEQRARRYPQKFSLLMLDIDDFKECNDSYGHPAGDEVLKSIGKILLTRSRSTDFVARYGGEEFAIIAPHTDKKNASVLAIRLLNAIATENFAFSDTVQIKVNVSIGLATFNEDADTKEDLLQNADKALYQAKKLGKKRVCLFGAGAEHLLN